MIIFIIDSYILNVAKQHNFSCYIIYFQSQNHIFTICKPVQGFVNSYNFAYPTEFNIHLI
ncbi:hypothetical protein BpHYR1_018196 [Brachionus plicatilis]|uniref:Uncharacterized protein n=1 Tax=Brachionus plicatilis TaxID=10195 RepID=A0A3M7P464_BRAPC|nr:hypothetical protein BpHYR1_018196 [Brachionus plicatilis]